MDTLWKKTVRLVANLVMSKSQNSRVLGKGLKSSSPFYWFCFRPVKDGRSTADWESTDDYTDADCVAAGVFKTPHMQYEGQFLISVFILPNGFQNVLYLNARQTQPSSNASTTRDLLLKMVNYLKSLVSIFSTLIGRFVQAPAKLGHFQSASGLYFCLKLN